MLRGLANLAEYYLGDERVAYRFGLSEPSLWGYIVLAYHLSPLIGSSRQSRRSSGVEGV